MSDENTASAAVDAKADKPAAPAAEEKKPAPGGAALGGEENKTVEVPAKFKSLVEEVEKMSVLDLAELVKVLEDKFGVSAAAPAVAIAAAPLAGAEAGAAEEKSEFTVELTAAGDSKINVIKAVKEVTGLGLADAKALVDGAPKALKEGVKKEEAEEIKKKIEEAGGKVTLK